MESNKENLTDTSSLDHYLLVSILNKTKDFQFRMKNASEIKFKNILNGITGGKILASCCPIMAKKIADIYPNSLELRCSINLDSRNIVLMIIK